jgi:chromosome segregation ATPase
MKEGYIQLKIAEINNKFKQLDQMISMEKKRLKLLEDRVGGFKDLIKKIRDIDNFKDELKKQIKKENQDLLSEEIKVISKKISDQIDVLVKIKIKEIEESIKSLSKRGEELKAQNDTISEIDKKVSYLLKHNELFMMKLVNKAILTDREVNEMHMMSSKKSG